MYGKLISSSSLSSSPLPLTPTHQSLGVHQNLNILLITASDQFQNSFENVWEEFVGGVAIDAKDGIKDKGSRASDTGWSVVLQKVFYTEFYFETISLYV